MLTGGYDEIGKHAGFRFQGRDACGFESHYPYHVGAKSAPLRFKAVPLGAALKLRSASLLLLSDPNPLRRAWSWLLVHDDCLHLFYQYMTEKETDRQGVGLSFFIRFFLRYTSVCNFLFYEGLLWKDAIPYF